MKQTSRASDKKNVRSNNAHNLWFERDTKPVTTFLIVDLSGVDIWGLCVFQTTNAVIQGLGEVTFRNCGQVHTRGEKNPA